MNSNLDQLAIIKGRKVVEIETEITETVPIASAEKYESLIEIPIKISFDDYTLFIYNRWIFNSYVSRYFGHLKGKMIIDINYLSPILRLVFEGLDSISIDLSDKGYIGPEALVLHGPDNLIMVWN